MSLPESPMRLTRRSLAEQVADALVDYIMTEGLEEGDSLPSTAELSERYDVSRTVIREALAALAGRGVLTRSQGRESVVATPDATDLTRLLQFRVHRDEVTLENIIDARLGLETIAARLAAKNATDEELEAMQLEMTALEEAKKESAYHHADIRVHRAIAVASHNPLIVLILDALGDFMMDFRVKATKNRKARGESLEPVIKQHKDIVEAIASRDVEGAGEAMRAHLAASREEIG